MDGQQQYADAMRAFDAYYGTRQQKFGMSWPAKRYAEHRSWKLFMKLAESCGRDGRDVERFVTVVTEHLSKNGDQVIPQDLMTKQAEQIWLKHRGDRKADAATKWSMLVRTLLQIQNASGQSDTDILSSAFNVQFPAWFRIVYPETMTDGIISAWGEEALDELRGDRDLVRFLRAAMAAKMEEFERRLGVINGL